MKIKTFVNTIFFVLLSSFCRGQYQNQCISENVVPTFNKTCNPSPWVLTFEDDFDGNTMDVVKWNPITGVPRDFNFTSQKAWHQPENLEVSSGSLKISAKRLDTQYTGTWVTNWNTTPYITQTSNFDYTTGEISSKQRFGFGKYEIRAKIPFGKGFLPAFWTFGGVGWNEIDVFEITTDNPYGYAMDIHHFSGTQQQGSYGCQETWNGPNFSAVPHTFTMIWDFFKIEWYVDGNLIRTVYKYLTQLGQPIDCNSFQPFHIYIQNKAFPIEDMHIILSNAVLIGNNGPNSNTPFPAIFEIDYIRYYSNDPCPTSGTVSSTLPCQDVLNKNGFYINDKLDLVTEVCPQSDIIIKAIPLNPSVCSNGYFLLSTNKELFISVTLCNDNLVPIDVEYSKWIEPGSATSFNLLANYSVFGVTVYPNLPSPYITFNPGQTYRIKVATSRCGWQQYTKFIRIASDVRNIDGSNIVSDVYGKYITISNSTVTQPKEIVAREYIKILPNSTLYAGTYRIDANFGCNDMLGREIDSTNEEVLRMNDMADENVLYKEEFTDVELNKETIAETKPSNSNFTIYPNPSSDGQFIIELTNKTTESTIEIYDLMGKKVWSKISPENKLEIDISNQPKGIYLVKVVSENNVIIQKIVYD